MTRFVAGLGSCLQFEHAMSICASFGLATNQACKCRLRFEDASPTKVAVFHSRAAMEDVRWLGFDWEGGLSYTSDYFEQLFQCAVQLITAGKAFVCELSTERIGEDQGDLTVAGKNSPFRDRPVADNLDLFQRMRDGEFPDDTCTLRARIDMAHPDLNMRDPVIYRVRHAEHHRTKRTWCIYASCAYARALSDAFEKITRSVYSAEFKDYRRVYDWYLQELGLVAPQQIELPPLPSDYAMMNEQRLLELVENGHVSGWDDARLPTIAGLRRRGCPPGAIRGFCEQMLDAEHDKPIAPDLLEACICDELRRPSRSAFGILDPLRVVVDNYPDGQVEELDAASKLDDPSAGTRKLLFSKNLYIDRNDFGEDECILPGRVPGQLRLRYGYLLTCRALMRHRSGGIVEAHCTMILPRLSACPIVVARRTPFTGCRRPMPCRVKFDFTIGTPWETRQE